MSERRSRSKWVSEGWAGLEVFRRVGDCLRVGRLQQASQVAQARR